MYGSNGLFFFFFAAISGFGYIIPTPHTFGANLLQICNRDHGMLFVSLYDQNTFFCKNTNPTKARHKKREKKKMN